MGTTICCITKFFSEFKPTDWITLTGIIVNAFLAIWIVKTIQNNLKNKRVLKDHFIVEIKEIRIEYRTCLTNLYACRTKAKDVIAWFKLMNIKVEDVMLLIANRYNIDKDILKPYQNELRELITENQEYINHFTKDEPIPFTENSKNQLLIFQQKHNHLFNDLITKINDAN